MFSKTTKRKIKERLYEGYSNVFRGMDVNNTNFSTEAHTTNSAVWPVPFIRIAISPGHSRSDPLSFPDHVPSSIRGDPGAVSRAGRKGATKVFKRRWQSPWVPTLTGPLFQMVKRMLAPDWAQKLLCIIFGAQSANSISWVLSISWVRTRRLFTRLRLVWKCMQSGNLNSLFQNTVYPKTKSWKRI